jgi:type I restriction enzyme S subunit
MGYIDSFMFDGEYLTWTTDGAHAGTVFHRTGKFNCTNVCGTLRPRDHVYLPFMRLALSIETKRHVRLDINPKLMNNMMARIRVNTPPIDEQVYIAQRLVQLLAGLEKAIEQAKYEVRLINEYRTRLITDVVTGKLDVRHLAPLSACVEVDDLTTFDAEEAVDDDLNGEVDSDLVEEVINADD